MSSDCDESRIDWPEDPHIEETCAVRSTEIRSWLDNPEDLDLFRVRLATVAVIRSVFLLLRKHPTISIDHPLSFPS